jgi:MarR family transcriptional regulator, 2-MHQ and catechol-resistance regulon repressor
MGTHYRGRADEVLALDLFVKLARAADSVGARLQTSDWKVTGSQFGVLEALLHLGPMCQKELGRKLLRSNSNVTTVIDNLERRGLVRRVRDAADRRFIEVQLTARGRRLIERAFPEHAARVTAVMSALSPEEQAALAGLLRKLGKAVARPATEPGPEELDAEESAG